MGGPFSRVIVLSALCTLVCTLTQSASAGPWFKHRFGELRSYHGAWLNVCDNNGSGECRSVQTFMRPGTDRFFGESKLTVYVDATGNASIELYDLGMPALDGIELRFAFGSKVILVSSAHWRSGAKLAENVAETVFFPPSEVTKSLVNLIRARNRVRVTYPLPDGTTGEALFSLRGSNAALSAITRHLESRQNEANRQDSSR